MRNAIEFAAIFAVWGAEQALAARSGWETTILVLIVLSGTLAKTLFFGIENMRQLFDAALNDWAYHRFLWLMLVNMSQIITSFALDFHTLETLNRDSFVTIAPEMRGWELIFEFFYFSTLNYTFFGYGDITPQTVVAKLVVMTEVVLAFTTVVFLLSDFTTMKQSLARRAGCEPPQAPPGSAPGDAARRAMADGAPSSGG